VLHHHRAFQRALGHGHDGGILNDDGLRGYGRQRSQRHQYEYSHRTSPGSWAIWPRPPGGVSAAGLYGLPSTNTVSMLVLPSKISPLVSTRLAILPFSMLPKRSATP